MSDQSTQLSENQQGALIYSLAEELGFPANTIDWVSASVIVLSSRKSSASQHSNAREVCSALLRDLNEFYAGDIEEGLRQTRITSSEDVGRIVLGLVSKQVIQADPGDSISQFDGLFRIDDIERFLAAEGIRRARFSWARCKHYASWTLYVVGTALVVASYARLVSHKVAWAGWVVGMVGFALSYLPDPKRKRF